MIDIDTCAFIAIVIGLVCYLWGYSCGSSFAIKEMNKKIHEKLGVKHD